MYLYTWGYISACGVHLWKITIYLATTAAPCHYLMCPFLLEKPAGREMARNTEGHRLMLSPAASPEAYCSTAPLRDGREVIWTKPQPQPWRLTSALTCYIKPGDGGKYVALTAPGPESCSWYHYLPIITALACSKWLLLAATINANTKLTLRAITARGTERASSKSR